MSTYTIRYSDELYHHGILGQKWGSRNGPPYPLDASDHSASEKKAGWRKSLGSSVTTRVDAIKRRKERDSAIQETYNKAERSIEKNYKRGQNLSDKDAAKLEKADLKARSDWKASKEQFKKDVALTDEEKAKLKKAAIIGGTIVAAGLVTYGAVKYGQLMEKSTTEFYMDRAQRHVDNIMNNYDSKMRDLITKQVNYSASGQHLHSHEAYEEVNKMYENRILERRNAEALANFEARTRIDNASSKEKRRHANRAIKYKLTGK